jgi:hypothetical protein
MKSLWTNTIMATSAMLLVSGFAAFADEPHFVAQLTGSEPTYEGEGHLSMSVINGGDALAYTLTFSALDAPINLAVIRVSTTGGTGRTAVVLCGGESTPACPAAGGTVRGVITADAIRAVPSAGLPAHDYATFLTLIKAGATTAVVHDSDGDSGDIHGIIHMVDGE